MKKILILFTSLFFASIAMAENEALYDKEAGSIEIPVLAVKGQSDKSTATLLQQDAERLIFTMTEMIPDASIESSTSEATYDPESGVIVLPVVMVLTEGEPSVETYSMELQQTEESIFEVTQKEKITALPLNATNGIAGEGAGLRMLTARSGGSSRWCSGNPDQNLDAAKQNFRAKCGEAWNDQKGHVCDYKSDGYHCNGNRSTAASPATSDPSSSTAADTGWCSGTPNRNIDTAKHNFHRSCGQVWNDQLGHVCEWKSDGWHCRGNKSASASSVPRAPRELRARRWHAHVVLIRWNISDYEDNHTYGAESRPRGFKIFRDGRQIAFVSKDKSEFVDKAAPSGRPSYQVVAVSAGNLSSPSSNVAGYSLTSRLATRNGDRLEYPTSGGTGSRGLRVSPQVIQGTPDSPAATFATVTDSNGENLGSLTVVHDGNSFVATADSPYRGESTYLAGGLPLSPERSEMMQQDFIEWLENSFPEKPRQTTTPGGGGGGGGGDGGCPDNDCTPGNEPYVSPSTDVDPGCSDSDCDPSGGGGTVSNPNDDDTTPTENPHP